MTAIFSSTALRALLIAVVLACVAAVTAPVARGASTEHKSAVTATITAVPTAIVGLSVVAEEWSWREFVKFWGRQAGSMSGVLGTVLLVGAGAVLLIMSKGK
jgi:hypothetical protein